jgi:hypothetical protein
MKIGKTAKIIIVISVIPTILLFSALIALATKNGPEYLSFLEKIVYFKENRIYKCPTKNAVPDPNSITPEYTYYGDTCDYYGDWVERNCPGIPVYCFEL